MLNLFSCIPSSRKKSIKKFVFDLYWSQNIKDYNSKGFVINLNSSPNYSSDWAEQLQIYLTASKIGLEENFYVYLRPDLNIEELKKLIKSFPNIWFIVSKQINESERSFVTANSDRFIRLINLQEFSDYSSILSILDINLYKSVVFKSNKIIDPKWFLCVVTCGISRVFVDACQITPCQELECLTPKQNDVAYKMGSVKKLGSLVQRQCSHSNGRVEMFFNTRLCRINNFVAPNSEFNALELKTIITRTNNFKY